MRNRHIKILFVLLLWPLSTFPQIQRIEIPKNLLAFTFQQDSDGCVWIGLSDGDSSGSLASYHNDTLKIVSGNESLPNGSYHSSLKLTDGSLMFGGNITNKQGKSLLIWVSNGQADTLQIPFALVNPFVNCISLVNRREIWIGTASGLLVNNRGQWSRYTVNHGLPDNFITAIHQDFRGIVWIGTERGIAYSIENQFRRIEQGSRIIGSATTFYSDNRGYVWAGSRFSSDGVSVYNGEVWETFSGRHGLIDNSASVFHQDSNGRLWVGSCYNRSRGGVSVFDGQKWVGYTSAKNLAKPCVDAIISDSKGRVWIGGSLSPRKGKGITVFENDNWQTIANNREMPAERVIAFFFDSYERLWISSFEGLFIVDPDKLVSKE